MPKIIARSPQESARIRLLDSAPQAGSGLNEWLAKGARMTSDLDPNESFDLIAEVVEAKGGRRNDRAIWRAINKIRGTDYNGPSNPKWPDANLELIANIVADGNGFGVAGLQERSPVSFSDELPHCVDVVKTLVARDDQTLICVGASNSDFVTSDFRSLRDRLTNTQLIVPSPMHSVWGKAQEGHDSMHTLDNTGPRRNIVLDFDIAKLNKEGNPTKWVPLIEKWEAQGITIKDATAALIWHLKQQGPLACVVDSAGKSLHA